jgi:hypothetical protein
MTTKRWIMGAFLLSLLCLAGPMTEAEGVEDEERRVRNGPSVSVFGQEIEIPANVIHRDPVVCIGCTARIEGEVRDNVVVIFGELEMDGAEIGNNVVGVFSKMRVRDSYVEETLVNALGSLDRDSLSGNVVNISLPFGWAPRVHTILFWYRAVGLLLAFIALVGAVSIAPERVEVLAREAPVRYFASFFVGLLGYLAFLIVLTLLMATIIGLPAGILFFKVLKWVGIAGIFLCLGRRIGRSFGREMSPLGAVLLIFGLYAGFVLLMSWLGIAGFIVLALFRLFFWLMFEVPAVGLMILTRFGTNGRTSVYAGVDPVVTVPPDPGPPPPVQGPQP